jgi:hypothetical protein
MSLVDFAALGHLPTELMRPPGIMEWFSWKFYDRLVTPRGMVSLQIVLVGSLMAATLGVATPISTKCAAILYAFYQGLLRSFGHFNHDEMTAVWFLFILALTPCGDGFSLDNYRTRSGAAKSAAAYGYPILLMRCLLAWVYFSAALLKLRLGGTAYFDPDSFITLAVKNSLGNMHDTQFRLAMRLANYKWLAAVGAVSAVVWELLFPLAVFSRRLRPWILGIGVMFHVATLLLMNISFPVQLAMYVVFINWTGLNQSIAAGNMRIDSSNAVDDVNLAQSRPPTSGAADSSEPDRATLPRVSCP